ncbi:MAG TPA: M23 family metallopeptidase [Sphingomicrobium sp.]|jgi:murein DD-endopeptidase MepM/ murein hydrolase activator NlpD|nr:M23 family metallopeptidase [Sphingomicrobium sp.]
MQPFPANFLESMDARPARRRALVTAAVAASAIFAITAAIALPSAARPSVARATAPPPSSRKPQYLSNVERPRAVAAAINSESSQRRFTGRVGQDLSRSLIAAGVPERQGREYVALLGKAIQLSDGLSVDDKFDLVIRRNSDGSLGQLLYAGMDRIARADVELMKWTDGKHVIWVNADGAGGGAGGSQEIRMPVQGRLTSGFGERFHPILGYERFHAGVDLGAVAGTPIVAAADGNVVSAGWAGGYGRAVAIAHAGGIETKYGHMSRISAYSGEIVRRGEVIGYVGSSGLSTGPHLHFEVMKNGRPVNPLSVKSIADGPGQLEGAKLAAFRNELRSLLVASAR